MYHFSSIAHFHCVLLFTYFIPSSEYPSLRFPSGRIVSFNTQGPRYAELPGSSRLTSLLSSVCVDSVLLAPHSMQAPFFWWHVSSLCPFHQPPSLTKGNSNVGDSSIPPFSFVFLMPWSKCLLPGKPSGRLEASWAQDVDDEWLLVSGVYLENVQETRKVCDERLEQRQQRRWKQSAWTLKNAVEQSWFSVAGGQREKKTH